MAIKNTLLSQAVVDAINAETNWPYKFTAERALIPIKELKELGETLYILVAPMGKRAGGDFEPKPMGRGKVQSYYEINIGVLQRCDCESADITDPLLDFVDGLTAFFEHRSLTVEGTTQVRVSRTEQGLVDGGDYLAQQFSSLISLTLDVIATR